jgi:hypothetical protein
MLKLMLSAIFNTKQEFMGIFKQLEIDQLNLRLCNILRYRKFFDQPKIVHLMYQ